MSPLLILPLYAPLTIAFSLDNDKQRGEFLFDAMVLRHTPIGGALMFSELEINTLRALREMLRAPVTPRRHPIQLEPSASMSSAASAAR